MDYIEDKQCDRILDEDMKESKEDLDKEIKKLIPENYKILILPAFFNYTD